MRSALSSSCQLSNRREESSPGTQEARWVNPRSSGAGGGARGEHGSTTGVSREQEEQMGEAATALPPGPCPSMHFPTETEQGRNPYPGQVHLSPYLSKCRGSLIRETQMKMTWVPSLNEDPVGRNARGTGCPALITCGGQSRDAHQRYRQPLGTADAPTHL